MRNLALIAVTLAAVGVVAPAGGADTSGGAVVVTVLPVRPYQPGDHVWLTTPPTGVATAAMFATGCERVPASGYIGTNVYANSNAHYVNFWEWGSASSSQPYYWYVKRTDNTNVDSGYSNGGGGQSLVGANVLYWKVQNKGATPQAWNVCYDVVS